VSVTVVLCVLGWIAGWFALGRIRTVDSLRTDEAGREARTGLRGVHVVVPARDEAHQIGRLLDELCDPDDPTSLPERIVVVDDHSTDGTAEVAAAHDGVQVVQSPSLPEGWTGKSWACATGVQHVVAQGAGPDDVLVFLDADVRIGRAALAAIVARRDERGGLVSVQPFHETRRPYEQLSSLFNVVAMMGTAVGGRRTDPTGAFGPVLVTSRSDYELAGGHGAVATEVVEDLAMARRYREVGLGVAAFAGGASVRFRMYPGGLGQLAEGWTKNFATGAGATPLPRLASIVLWITALGSAAIALLDGLVGAAALSTGVVLYAAFALQLIVMFGQVGRFGVTTAVLYPVPLLFFLAVFVHSLWRTHVRHSVTWRGRAISTAARRS
jgi:4,4'-diaponeurosporenoate glycosyltransferase